MFFKYLCVILLTFSYQVVLSGEDSDTVSALVWWCVPTSATVHALYSLAYSVAQPSEISGIVHPDDVTRKLNSSRNIKLYLEQFP